MKLSKEINAHTGSSTLLSVCLSTSMCLESFVVSPSAFQISIETLSWLIRQDLCSAYRTSLCCWTRLGAPRIKYTGSYSTRYLSGLDCETHVVPVALVSFAVWASMQRLKLGASCSYRFMQSWYRNSSSFVNQTCSLSRNPDPPISLFPPLCQNIPTSNASTTWGS